MKSDSGLSVPESRPAVLEAIGISKSFPGVRALHQVSLEAYPGELTAVLGENGAGKSTLMNILSGVYRPDKGEVRLDGTPVTFRSPQDALEGGISTIFQELNLIGELSAAENLFLGREFLSRLGLIDYPRMNEQASALLGRLGLDIDPRTPVSQLRVGQQQIVEIAKGISCDARVLIMDEPTSALSDQEIEVLFDIVEGLKQDGVALLYITHKLEELSRIADRYTVLRDGERVDSGLIRDTATDDLIRLMVGREINSAGRPPAADPNGTEVFRVEALTLEHPSRRGDPVVKDIGFHVDRGEIVGFFGLMGAGRTELFETICGLHRSCGSGEIRVDGSRVEIRSPRDAIACGIAWAPEDRKREGLVLDMSVAENTSLACLEDVERYGFLDPGRERKLVEKLLDRMKVKTPSLRTRMRNLSGGNQQKVILARWLAIRPRVLLLDEPTRGIDINAKAEIYALLAELAAAGLAIVLVSSELPELLENSDRILVLSEGGITAEFNREEATEEALVRAALPRAAIG